MVDYYPAALGIAVMTLQHQAPMIETDTPETNEPKQTQNITVRARTRQKVVRNKIMDEGSFHGQGWELVYISAPALAEVLDVSTETARRRLNYFEEQGVLELIIEGRPNYYLMNPEFTAVNDDNVRPESEVITTAKKFIEAAEED